MRQALLRSLATRLGDEGIQTTTYPEGVPSTVDRSM
jgi:hypothetical protein